MTSSIQVLDDQLINQIAAGEVIERPASVVKELVENAIDAQGKNINILIEEGGLTRIEVEDDGIGITFDEVETAFLRHATSKIKAEDDLFCLHSLGFRGEALPSIASIARVELFTATADGKSGKHIALKGGVIQKSVPIPFPSGSKFIVQDLFFNTPVRRNFIKSSVSEFQKVYDVVQKLALSRTDISFRFQHNQRFYFKTPGNGNLADTIVSLWGVELHEHLLLVSYQGEAMSLNGLISRPDYKRNDRKRQYFFINGRSIHSPMLAKAVEEAYRGLLVSKEFPVVFLSFNLPTPTVDVNVHPQKLQVRLQDEGLLFRAVRDVLRAKLRELFQQVELGSMAHPEVSETSCRYGLTTVHYQPPMFIARPEDAKAYSLPCMAFSPETDTQTYTANPPVISVNSHESSTYAMPIRIIGQIYSTYLLVMLDEKFWIVDQHAAHERINYNLILQSLTASVPQSQMLLLPLTIQVSSLSMERWEKNRSMIEQAGFSIEPLGERSLIIRAVPEFLSTEDFDLDELIEAYASGREIEARHKLAAAYACKKSIKAGEVLTREESEQLLQKLLATEDYKHCPHGRPTLLELSRNELEKFFKRTK